MHIAEFSVFKRCSGIDLGAQARWGESWAPYKTLGRGIATKRPSGAHLSEIGSGFEHGSIERVSSIKPTNAPLHPRPTPCPTQWKKPEVKAKPYVRCYSFIYHCSPLQLRPSPSPSPTILHSRQLLLLSIHSFSFQLTCCTILRWCILTHFVRS